MNKFFSISFKTYLVLWSCFFGCGLFAQEQHFVDVLALFSSKNQHIPQQVAEDFFGFKKDEKRLGLLTETVLVKHNTYTILEVKFQCPDQEICEESWGYSFSKEGKLIDKLPLYKSVSGCSFLDTREKVYTGQSLLVVKESRKKLDCLKDQNLLSERHWFEFIDIHPDGSFSRPETKNLPDLRDHFEFSYKKFTAAELDFKTYEELGIIKNEIFAAHGYKFKSPKWQNYFSTKNWYQPRFEEVSSMLTDIEKHNIDLILRLLNE